MSIDFLFTIFKKNNKKNAIIWHGQVYTYQWLLERIYYFRKIIKKENVLPGEVVALEVDFSPSSVSFFLALIEHGCILVLLTNSVEKQKDEFIKIAQGEICFKIDDCENVIANRAAFKANHQFYQTLRKERCPGLVLFSSGSTGKSKAIVHNLAKLLGKFKIPRVPLSTITFLLFDHIGGLNTMFYTLSNGGCMVMVSSRNPDEVLKTIEQYQVELLPTSPTFINLILLSEAYKRYNLSSLKIITYGTESMPESTLVRFHNLFPQVKLQQTYGLSEVGILRSKSKNSDSLWMKIGGEGFKTKIVDGILQIKAESSMLGYLNAASPFTKDGWLITGDAVEVDGEYIKILGRKSDIINVGGEKVYPAEVESVIIEHRNVAEAIVYGEKNHIIGEIVCAKVRLVNNEAPEDFILDLKKHCYARLQKFKVPVKIFIDNEYHYSGRFKKMRREV